MQSQDSASSPEFLPAQIGNVPITMSSVELADICETRHNQVVETIDRLFEKGVLRESRKTTRRVQPDGGGRPMDVYDLTKRDSLVVVSGYNDEVRARIIDRWIELEQGTAAGIPLGARTENLASVFGACKRIAEIAGITGNQSILSAAQAARRMTGTDPLALIGAGHLMAPQQEALLNPSDVGERLGGMKGHQVNTLLTNEGFQTQHRDKRNKSYYEPTPKGVEAGGVMQDTGKKSGGVPVRQLRWASRIVTILRSVITSKAA